MQCKQIVFTEPHVAKFMDATLPELTEHKVMVKTCVSTVSGGTERANFVGDPSTNPTKAPSVDFPRRPGYSSSGVVVDKGSAVTSVEIGDRVVVFGGKHREFNVINEDCVVRIPEGVSLETGAMCYISSFPMAAIRKTRLEIGESAIVMGLGILGMMAVKILRAAGAVPIIAADPNPRRRAIALQNGADYALDPTLLDFADEVKHLTNGGANVAIEVTGVGAGLNEALDSMAKFGRVALLGCTRSSDFTVDYYRKVHAPGITLIGAHTMARPDIESHPGWFTERDDIIAMLKLCESGRCVLENLVEETHKPEECQSVYDRLASDGNFPIALQFEWRTEK